MKYEYTTVFPPDYRGRFRKQPRVEVKIYGPKGISPKISALVDSGADYCLFNLEIAKYLGIDLSHTKEVTVTGITGQGKMYFAEIEMEVEHLNEKLKIDAGFIDSQFVDALLGQMSFFETHRIKFEKDHNIF